MCPVAVLDTRRMRDLGFWQRKLRRGGGEAEIQDRGTGCPGLRAYGRASVVGRLGCEKTSEKVVERG